MPGDRQTGDRVWDRVRRRPGAPVAGMVMSVLAIFGALVIGLAIREGSVAAAGARVDQAVAAVITVVR